METRNRQDSRQYNLTEAKLPPNKKNLTPLQQPMMELTYEDSDDDDDDDDDDDEDPWA